MGKTSIPFQVKNLPLTWVIPPVVPNSFWVGVFPKVTMRSGLIKAI